MIGGLKNTSNLRWANPLELKNTVEKVFVDTFGSKDEALAKLKTEKSKVWLRKIDSRNFPLTFATGCKEANPEGIYL